MEEREKLWIYIAKRDRETYLGWSSLKAYIFMCARSNARHRYVDRLTKKQQNAINYLRMLDMDEVIPGVGCKMGGYGNKKLAAGMGTIRVPVTVYLLNC